MTGDFETVGNRSDIEDDLAYPPHPEAIAAFDFSFRTVPEEWTAAAQEAPNPSQLAPIQPSTNRGIQRGLDHRTRRAARTEGLLGAILGGLVGGVCWYATAVTGLASQVTDGPFLALPLGVLVGLSAGSNRNNPPGSRAASALAVYCLTLLATFTAITVHGLYTVYGGVAGMDQFENTLFRLHLDGPLDVALALLGGAAAVATAGLLRRPR